MDTEFVETELNGVKLRVFKDGTIMKFCVIPNQYFKIGWNICSHKPHQPHGYCMIKIKNKNIMTHRIIAMVYLGLDIYDLTKQIDHIDRCRTNNNINNLRIVTNQQNQFNTNHKGYSWHSLMKKWCTRIRVNKKIMFTNYFNTEEEARNAYLEAKEKYHIILPHQNPHLHLK